MPPTTATKEDTVWVKNLATGHTQGMTRENAAYYLNQRDPITGAAQYAEGTAPESKGDRPKNWKESQEQAKRTAATIQAPTKGDDPDPAVRDSTQPHVPHGVPDAARMEVAVGASETGPTLRAETDTKAVVGGEDPQARQVETAQAATEGQAAAEVKARKKAGSKAKAAGSKSATDKAADKAGEAAVKEATADTTPPSDTK